MISTYPSSSKINPFLRNYAQKKAPHNEICSSVMLDGTEHIVSHEGISQYNRAGSGAATSRLAALNFARVSFLKEQDGLRNGALVEAILSRSCAEETAAVCALFPGNLCLEVEDIYRVPVFKKTLDPKTTKVGQPGIHHFRSLLTDLIYLDSSAVVVITRPPDILACLKLRLSECNVFIIFDPHRRPSYPHGARSIVNTSLEGTARCLSGLLPSVHFQDGILQWQTQRCSGHVFVPRNPDTSAAASALESSLTQLSLQTEISRLRSQNLSLRTLNDFQIGEQSRLEMKLKEVEERCQRQERDIQELKSSINNARPLPHIPTPQSLPSSSSSSTSWPPSSHNPFAFLDQYTATSHASGSRSAGPTSPPLVSNNPFIVPSQDPPPSYDTSPQSAGPSHDLGGSSPPVFDWDASYASYMQAEFDVEDCALSAERAALCEYDTAHTTDPPSAGPSYTYEGPPVDDDDDDDDDDFLYAMRLQNEFDNEHNEPSAEPIALIPTTPPVFECGICMEEMAEDSIARLDECEHAFCRDCMYGYVSSKLEEHKFPILCPTCTADKGKGRGVTGEVSQAIAIDLGLTDEQFKIWSEMELVSFSVLLSCRRCERSMFVARDDHEEAQIIACPLPDCDNIWCKQCQQTVDAGGPRHSCDGTAELDHLMRQQGWKYCPSCRTPIQKTSGCNHMTCQTPACNTHFCYNCGGLIVKSALSQDVEQATTSHFRAGCTLFEVPANTGF